MLLPELASTGLPALFIGTLTPDCDMTCVTGVMWTGFGAARGAGAVTGTECCGMSVGGTKLGNQSKDRSRDTCHSLSIDGSKEA